MAILGNREKSCLMFPKSCYNPGQPIFESRMPVWIININAKVTKMLVSRRWFQIAILWIIFRTTKHLLERIDQTFQKYFWDAQESHHFKTGKSKESPNAKSEQSSWACKCHTKHMHNMRTLICMSSYVLLLSFDVKNRAYKSPCFRMFYC